MWSLVGARAGERGENMMSKRTIVFLTGNKKKLEVSTPSLYHPLHSYHPNTISNQPISAHNIISSNYPTTQLPTVLPPYHPTTLPSYHPTILPSYHPTILPSYHPTIQPSNHLSSPNLMSPLYRQPRQHHSTPTPPSFLIYNCEGSGCHSWWFITHYLPGY